MNETIQLEEIDGIGVFRPVGACSAKQAAHLFTLAIERARERSLGRLLVVITGLSGFAPPTLSERHLMVRAWANAAQGRVRVAMVTTPDFIDPEKFGVVAAANFGLTANVFSNEAAASAWLKSLD